jgi:hypothetical protein
MRRCTAILALLLATIVRAQAPIVDSVNSGSRSTAGAVAERTAPAASGDDPVVRLQITPVPELAKVRTLREALGAISRGSGVPITGLWRRGAGGDALDPETPLAIEVRAGSCADALDAIADFITRDGEPMRWQRVRDGIEFGRRSRLWRASALEVRVHDVRDLLLHKPAFLAAGVPGPSGGTGSGGGSGNGSTGGTVVDPAAEARRAAAQNDLRRLIELTVEPEAWEARGGPCSITPHDGLLVIRAPDFVHRLIDAPRPARRSTTRTDSAPRAGSRAP